MDLTQTDDPDKVSIFALRLFFRSLSLSHVTFFVSHVTFSNYEHLEIIIVRKTLPGHAFNARKVSLGAHMLIFTFLAPHCPKSVLLFFDRVLLSSVLRKILIAEIETLLQLVSQTPKQNEPSLSAPAVLV